MRIYTIMLMSCLVLCLALGCQDTSQLESRIAEYQQSVESRMDATDEKIGKLDIDSMKYELSQLKTQMGEIQQSYSPELRKQLQQNLDDASRNSDLMEEAESAAKGLLERLKQIESESIRLRNQTEQHSIQAKALDKIGELEATLSSVKATIERLEKDVRRAKQDAASAKSRAISAMSAARRKR